MTNKHPKIRCPNCYHDRFKTVGVGVLKCQSERCGVEFLPDRARIGEAFPAHLYVVGILDDTGGDPIIMETPMMTADLDSARSNAANWRHRYGPVRIYRLEPITEWE